MIISKPVKEKKFNSFKGERTWQFPFSAIFGRKETGQTQIFEITFR